MVTRQIAMTADELFRLPDSEERHELVDGELITVSPAFADHSALGVEITRLVANYVVDRDLGTVFGADSGFQLSRDPDTVLVPDVSFISKHRLPPRETWRRFLPLAPDLVFEILSSSNTSREMAEKTRRYFAAGSRMVVIVDPFALKAEARTPRVNKPHILSIGDTLELDDIIPGFRIPMKTLFRAFLPER